MSVRPHVLGLVARFAPGAPEPAALVEEARLARDLGFDSLRIVELLLACQEGFAAGLPIEELLAGPPLTVGHVVAHVAAHAAPDLP